MPLLLFSGDEFWPPLAIVMAGGVGLSIILSLVFTPVAYARIARRGATPRAVDADPAVTGRLPEATAMN